MSSQVENINTEALPFICTHSLKKVFKREKNKCAERREKQLSGFHTALVEFYTEEVLRGFLPFGFPKENIYVFCVVVLVSLSMILL